MGLSSQAPHPCRRHQGQDSPDRGTRLTLDSLQRDETNSDRPTYRRPTVGRGGVVVGPILPAKMPCNTHTELVPLYRKVPGNLPVVERTQVIAQRFTTTPNHHLRVHRWPLRGLWSQTSCLPCLRALAARQRRKLYTMDAEWAVSNPSTPSNAIVRREAPSLTMAASKIQTPGAVWSGLREWPRTTARRLSPWKRVGERDRNLYH
jgi:hypothetical protein